jgi:hypothetical protein
VDNDQAAARPTRTEMAETRRKFLRHVGMGGAATAALLGLTEIAGLPSAAAGSSPHNRAEARKKAEAKGRMVAKRKAVRGVNTQIDGCLFPATMSARYNGGHCTSDGSACPTGNCCYEFTGGNMGAAAKFNMCFPTNTGRAKGCPSFFTDQWCA